MLGLGQFPVVPGCFPDGPAQLIRSVYVRQTFGFDYGTSDLLNNLGDDGVSKSSKAVHPVGYPMSHSTHSGFREPPTTAFSGRLFRSL